jgi:hypothetical protein
MALSKSSLYCSRRVNARLDAAAEQLLCLLVTCKKVVDGIRLVALQANAESLQDVIEITELVAEHGPILK